MRETLLVLSGLLRGHAQLRWAETTDGFAAELARASTQAEVADVARGILRMYNQGMGGWQDLVPYDGTSVSPAQNQFQALRSELFHQAVAGLSTG
jgi:hypothetical protein